MTSAVSTLAAQFRKYHDVTYDGILAWYTPQNRILNVARDMENRHFSFHPGRTFQTFIASKSGSDYRHLAISTAEGFQDIGIEYHANTYSTNVSFHFGWERVTGARYAKMEFNEQVEAMFTPRKINPKQYRLQDMNLVASMLEAVAATGNMVDLADAIVACSSTIVQSLSKGNISYMHQVGSTRIINLLKSLTKNDTLIETIELAFKSGQTHNLLSAANDLTRLSKYHGEQITRLRSLGWDWPELGQLETILMLEGKMAFHE